MKKLKLIIAVAVLAALTATLMLSGCAGNKDQQPLSLEEIFLTDDNYGGACYGTWKGYGDRRNNINHFDSFDISSLKSGTNSEKFSYIRLFFNYDNVKNRHYGKVKLKLTAAKDVETIIRFQDSYLSSARAKIFGEKTINLQAGILQEIEVDFSAPINFQDYNTIYLSDPRVYLYDFSIKFWTECQEGSAEWVQWANTEYTISDFELIEVVS